MRHLHDKEPEHGDTRTVTRFLWWPKVLFSVRRECRELRWLEKTGWVERFMVFSDKPWRTTTLSLWYPFCWAEPRETG